ncbi:MAG: hypothetical protein GY727_11800, partial [Gammaproteobacteria bacterium]|nr:hypothetical protein [Gammaproteobacteria bacterium]
TGIKAISFDGATLEYNAISAINEIIQQHAFVCILYFNLTNDEVQLIADERHGMHMPAATHMYNHNTYGARYSGGFDPAGFVNASGTYTQTNSGSLWDEDIEINAPVQTSHPFIYRLGSNGDWNWTTADLNVSYNGGGNAYYNEYTGATWQLTTIPNNDYSLVHFVATNDSQYPVVKILGQTDYPNRNTARAAIETEIASIKFGGLPSAEFIFLYSIIVRHSNVLQDLADGSTFVDFRSGVTGAGGTAATVTDHGDLLGLGDNDHPQYLQNLVEDTSPQQGGDVDLNGFGDKLTGQTVAGSNGDWVRLSGAETWSQADASVEATSVGQLGRRISATEVKTSGPMAATGLTAGATYYLSETAGGMVTTAPTDPGTIRRIVGHAVTTTLFMVNPSGTWLEN